MSRYRVAVATAVVALAGALLVSLYAGPPAVQTALIGTALAVGVPVALAVIWQETRRPAQNAAAAPPAPTAPTALPPTAWGHTVPMALSAVRAPLTPPAPRRPRELPAAPPLPR